MSGLGAANLAVDGNAASRVFHIAVGATVTISGLTIRNGASGQGGGILNDHATLTLINSTLSGNSATNGAAVFNAAEGGKATLTVTNSTLSGNSAAGGASGQGGGVYNDGGFAGNATLTLTNSTVSGNSSTAEAGGIFNLGFQGTAMLRLTNCTLSNNSSGAHGGGIYNFGGSGSATLELGNTILKTGTSGENILNDSGSVTSDGHNLSSDAGVTTDNGGTGSLNATGDQINTDPKLRPLANYGGPTLTHALLPGSPALDAGDNTLALTAGLTTDGRGAGFSRVLDAASDADTTQTVDIGAFEADPSVEDISDKSTNEDTPLSFTFHVGDDNANSTPFDNIFGTSTNTTLVPNENIQVTGNSGTGQRTLTIMPAANLNGVVTIAVTVIKTINHKVLSVADTFVLTVNAVNDPPVANSQSVATNSDTATAITLTASDVDGDTLAFSIVVLPAHGALTGTPPNLTYTPASNYNGSDSFTFKANDGSADSNTATVSITIVASTPTPTPTATATATATPSAAPGLVGNVSTRLPVGADDNALIEGFIVQGPAGSTKKILVRAIGPSLIPFGIADAVANPTLDIFDENNVKVAANDDWRATQVGGLITGDQSAEISASQLAPGNDLESAIIANLAPGSYTAVVRGAGNTIGTGVVDAYDLNAASPARLANIATRGLIQPGDQLMIAGFIIQNAPVRLVIRAIGPSLSAFGITNALTDTTLQLRDQNGVIVRENDDWKTDQQQELESTGLQPTDHREAALIATIPPGQYTAQVRGKPESTGTGVVQVYFLQ